MQTNNKLREACANIAEYARSAMCHATDAHVLGYLNQIEGWAKATLAEPIKNCEVGTSDEQAERFENFCLEHIGCAEETGGRHCVGCPLEKASKKTTQKCELYWAQLPYEEGGDR